MYSLSAVNEIGASRFSVELLKALLHGELESWLISCQLSSFKSLGQHQLSWWMRKTLKGSISKKMCWNKSEIMVSVHYSQLFSLLCVFTSDLFWSSGEQRLTKITNKAKRFKKGAGKSNVIELFLVFHGVIGVIHSSKNVFSSYPVDFDVTECAIPTMYGLGQWS